MKRFSENRATYRHPELVEVRRNRWRGPRVILKGALNTKNAKHALAHARGDSKKGEGGWRRSWQRCVPPPGAAIPKRAGPRLERNVRIENNLFRTFDPAILHARNVDGLTFAGNRVETTDTYRAHHTRSAHLTLHGCVHVHTAGDRVSKGHGGELRVETRAVR
ncbi:MAG: hypothetical protein GF331_19450 [Chitinivibrionales bacterium]|nr:hypothetical protein [Chitinivibrionales bacterium]